MLFHWWTFAIIVLLGIQNGEGKMTLNADCTTPDGNPGKCKRIEDCLSFRKLMNKPSFRMSRADKTYLRKSKCDSDGEEILLCCFECGQAKSRNTDRILNGTKVVLGTWPWMAALRYNSPDPDFSLLCGGSLISDRWVVTAAHCIMEGKEPKIVRLGELDISSDDDTATPEDVGIEKIFVHPQFDKDKVLNDIALIRLNRTVKYKFNIRPICLPSNKSELYNNKKMYNIAGWGSTGFGETGSNILLEAPVRGVDESECKKNYADPSLKTVVDARVICAGKNGRDTCQGDSGGPLALPGMGKYQLVGVVSKGAGCGDQKYPGIYTKIVYFIDWINKVMESK